MAALAIAILTGLFNAYLALFAWAGVWGELVGLSLLTALLALLIFRRVSNQRALRRAKDLLISDLLEIALYRDDLRVVFRAQAALLRDNLRYLLHAAPALCCLVLPVALIFGQGEMRYRHRPLRVGEQAILAVKVPAAADLGEASLVTDTEVVVETPSLRVPAQREVDWRIRAVRPGRHRLRVRIGRQETSAWVLVGDLRGPGRIRVPVGTDRQGWWQWLSTPPGTASGRHVARVIISYPTNELRLGRWKTYWVWPWLVISLAFGYGLKGVLRVEI